GVSVRHRAGSRPTRKWLRPGSGSTPWTSAVALAPTSRIRTAARAGTNTVSVGAPNRGTPRPRGRNFTRGSVWPTFGSKLKGSACSGGPAPYVVAGGDAITGGARARITGSAASTMRRRAFDQMVVSFEHEFVPRAGSSPPSGGRILPQSRVGSQGLPRREPAIAAAARSLERYTLGDFTSRSESASASPGAGCAVPSARGSPRPDRFTD